MGNGNGNGNEKERGRDVRWCVEAMSARIQLWRYETGGLLRRSRR